MADIKLRIEVNPNAESEVLGTITNNVGEISNTSIKANNQGEFQNIPTTEFSGSNGLTWTYGYLVFNEDGYLDNVENSNAYLESEQSPDQFFWGAVPESKEYRVKLTFSNASNLKDIIIYGDKTNNQFPTEAIIDGETVVTSDDAKWAINLLTESDTHTIEFTKWNRANYNATITLIRIMLKYWEVDKFNGLKSVESLSQITGQPQDIFYGVVPSDGSAQIIDHNGEIYDMVNDGIIPNSNLKVEVFANGRKMQQHITQDTTYDNTQILEIAFTNSLSNWDNIKFTGMKLREQTSLYEVLKYILTNTNYISESSQMDVMLGNKVYYEGLYIPLKEYLQNIIIPYPYLEASSLREAVDKVCALAQLNVVENEVGEVKFISARPIIDIDKPIIKVTPKEIKSNPYRDVILKNKYNNINVGYLSINSTFVDIDSRNLVIYENPTDSNANNILSQNTNISVIAKDIPFEGNTESSQQYYSIIKYNFSLGDTSLIKTNFNYSINYNINIFNGSNTNSTKGSVYDDNFFDYYNGDRIILSNWVNRNNLENIVSIKKGLGGIEFAVRKEDNDSLTIFVLMLNKYLNYAFNEVENKYNILTSYRLYSIFNLDFNAGSIKTELKQTLQEYDYSLDSNELFQESSKIYNQDTITYLAKNISEDYGNGIVTAEIEVICSDLYDVDGNKVKEWASGKTYEIGDIIRIDKDKEGNSLWNYKDGNPMYWQVVSRNFRKKGVPAINLGLRECKYSVVPPLESVSFARDSWDTINTIAGQYKGQEYYKVGDEKTITLSTGEQVTLQILGFNHDDLTSGGKANITIGMKNLLADTYRMNTSNTNAGGWKNCYFRNTTLSQIFSKLPAELQSVIKIVDKECSVGGGSANKTLVSDNLFLFSEYEIFGWAYFTLAKEGTQYQYWRNLNPDGNPRTAFKYLNNGSGNNSIWWLRSPSDNNQMVSSINTNFSGAGAYTSYDWSGGYNVGYTSAGSSVNYGICLGFCI